LKEEMLFLSVQVYNSAFTFIYTQRNFLSKLFLEIPWFLEKKNFFAIFKMFDLNLLKLLLVLLLGSAIAQQPTNTNRKTSVGSCTLSPILVSTQVSGNLIFTDTQFSWNINIATSQDVNVIAEIRQFGQLISNFDIAPLGDLVSALPTIHSTTGTMNYTQDLMISLSGEQSVIGKSVALKMANTGEYFAVCVIGIGQETNDVGTNYPMVSKATCLLKGTVNYPNVRGYIDFLAVGNEVQARIIAQGLPAGDHPWHIHTFGNVSSPTAAFVGTHLGLNCGCRTSGSLNETGAFGNTAYLTSDSNKMLRGFVADKVVTLSGINNIIGRAVVLHDGTNNKAYAAQCVIGIAAYSPPQLDQQVIRANALVMSSPLSKSNMYGYVDFDSVQNGIKVTYFITGLPPSVNLPWHVHVFGDLTGFQTNLAVNGHFIGTPAMRDEIGKLNNGNALKVDSNGIAQGEFIDTEIKFDGVNSIIGRSLIIHDSSDAKVRIGIGVIGISNQNAEKISNVPSISHAICRIQKDNVSYSNPIDGFVIFGQSPGSSTLNVRYNFIGLPASASFPWHIHSFGDLMDYQFALSTGPHFVGSATLPDEVGRIKNNTGISSDKFGYSNGIFEDARLKLNGIDSIIGRSLVIHSNIDSAARIAFCVIGILRENDSFVSPPAGNTPLVIRAQSQINPLSQSAIRGQIEFIRDVQSNSQFSNAPGLIVRYVLSGLPESANLELQVFEYGDELSKNGDTLGNSYNAMLPSTISADINGNAVGSYFDPNLELNGDFSIVGRSVSIVANINGVKSKLGFGIIGRGKEGQLIAADGAKSTAAGCFFKSTSNFAKPVLGWVKFSTLPGKVGSKVTYYFNGLAPGLHPWHIHALGNVANQDGSSVQGHFIGYNFTGRMEIGMINYDTPLEADSLGTAYGTFFDDLIQLNGPNSIIGRSMIIHEPSNSRSAQCVIGRIENSDDVDNLLDAQMRPRVKNAFCYLNPTKNYSSNLKGTLSMQETQAGLQFKYSVQGNLQDGTYQFFVFKEGYEKAIVDHIFQGYNGTVGRLSDAGIFHTSKGASNGVFVDKLAALNGGNSVVGRRLVLGDSTGNPLAHCTIGIDDEEQRSEFVPDFPVSQGLCFLKATTVGTPGISGLVEFSQKKSSLMARVVISGLALGNYPWHIHVKGNIGSQDGQSETGHLINPCNQCRPNGILQESGQIGGGVPLNADENGFIADTKLDSVLSLYGSAAIIGRSVMLHNSVNGRIAHCVVGYASEPKLQNIGSNFVQNIAANNPGNPLSPVAIFFIAFGAFVFIVGGLFVYRRIRQRRIDGVDPMYYSDNTELSPSKKLLIP
jgi:Cu/Zn superoxide dismutase